MLKCKHCESLKVSKNGINRGIQRYVCKNCKRTFSIPKISDETKQRALQMYLNNVGIRKIALFLGVSPPAVLYWIKQSSQKLSEHLQTKAKGTQTTDIIEFDEIYTYVQKNGKKQ